MTEYTIDMIKGTTVMEQMRSLIKVVIDFINGEGGDIDELRQMIQTEIADRTAQDGQLQLQIQAEATARISQDNELRTAIQNEVTARQTQDSDLNTQIQAEATARTNQDNDLYDRVIIDLTFESQNREAADAELRTAIQNEVTARQNQDTQLDTAIQNEASQRASADSGLSHNITDLTTRVGTVETSVSEIIQGTQVVGAAQNQGHADTQSEAQVGDHIVSTTANIGDDTHPVKIVNGVPVQIADTLATEQKLQNKLDNFSDSETTYSSSNYSQFKQYLDSCHIGERLVFNTLTLKEGTTTHQFLYFSGTKVNNDTGAGMIIRCPEASFLSGLVVQLTFYNSGNVYIGYKTSLTSVMSTKNCTFDWCKIHKKLV